MDKVQIKCKISISSYFDSIGLSGATQNRLALIFTLSPLINQSTHRHLKNNIQVCSVLFVIHILMNAFTKEVFTDFFSQHGETSEFDA